MQIDWNQLWDSLKLQLTKGSSENLNKDFLNRCVLSASGLRFIHSGDEEDLNQTPHADSVDFAICVIRAFAKMLKERNATPTIWLGMDARPTGPSFLLLAERLLTHEGIQVKLMGHGPIPEVMAATHQNKLDGFCYFTASHNPAGHNGFKLGFSDGAVLNREASAELIREIQAVYKTGQGFTSIKSSIATSEFEVSEFLNRLELEKKESLNRYESFALSTVAQERGYDWVVGVAKSWTEKPLFLIDMNGSSRLESIDLTLLGELGLEVELINDELGSFAHAIVPEGKSLEPLQKLMQQRLDEGRLVLGGLVPDCDGDRGNLILPISGKACALKAQETFALCALAEFSTAFEAKSEKPLACGANGPTSLRIEKLLEPYGVKVERAEVGEANVLAKAQELRDQGCWVPISGEGSNGGNILDGGTVRDPLMTLLSLLKFTQTKGDDSKTALEKCLERENQEMKADCSAWETCFQLLPSWETTDAFEGEALMPVPKIEHEVLKQNYEKELSNHYQNNQDFWSSKGIAKLSYFSNEGTKNIAGPGNRPAPGKGGLQIFLLNSENQKMGFLWMRGSGTEPVFRLVVDWGGDKAHYRELLDLHRELILKSTS